MSSPSCGLCLRSIGELSLVVSRASSAMISLGQRPSDLVLQKLWQSSRSLERIWTHQLEGITHDADPSLERFEKLAASLFVTEMLVRTVSSVINGMGNPSDRHDLALVTQNIISGFTRVRNAVLEQLLKISDSNEKRAYAINTLRRKTERWTDWLISGIAIETDDWQYAFDVDRCKDFAEEHGDTSVPANHLATIGIRLALIQNLPDFETDEPEIRTLVQAVLFAIPSSIMRRDGSLLSSIELRLIAGRLGADSPTGYWSKSAPSGPMSSA